MHKQPVIRPTSIPLAGSFEKRIALAVEESRIRQELSRGRRLSGLAQKADRAVRECDRD
jgi:hypothetical protein